jgi:hypothetical protein
VAYLGNDLQVAYPTYKNIDDISGSFNSSATSFPLLVNGVAPVPLPLNSQQCIISVGGVIQRPDDTGAEGFRLSGGNIVFSSAPNTGEDFFGVILAGADYVNAGGAFPTGSGSVPSITFAGDTDTGFFNYAPNEIGFGTGGVHHLTLTTAGQLAHNSGSAAAPSYSFTGDLNTGIYQPAADTVGVATNGTGRLFIDSSGRLGVGVSSPANLLHINGGDQTTPALKVQSAIYPVIDLYSDFGGNARNWRIAGVYNAAGTFEILSSTTAGGEPTTSRFAIDSSGRVGIGTTSPLRDLQIGDNTSAAEIISLQTTTAGNGSIYFGDNTATSAEYAGVLRYSHSDDAMQFWTSSTERARLTSSGQWLVGTSSTSAGSKLVVQGGVGSNTGVIDVATSLSAGASLPGGSEIGAIRFTDANANRFGLIICAADGSTNTNDYPGRLVFSTTADGASSPTERMRIDRNGVIDKVVGVYNNTTAVAANLFIGPGGDFNRSTSSAKYKTQIESIEDIYSEAILQCRPVWYRSTCKGDNPDHGWWGFIAEEVAEIDPRLVQWKTIESAYDENGSLVQTPCEPEPEGVSYDRFVPHLLNLIKRQMERIEQLETEMAAVKAQQS